MTTDASGQTWNILQVEGCMSAVAAVPALAWMAGVAVQPWSAALSAVGAAALVGVAGAAALSVRPSAVRAAIDA